MSFIDNSGDIILDAVLTDLGRELMARGDGSFKIDRFGLGDDEINYALYDASAATNAESTTIKQLPVFEAFTNNTVALKHRLINIVRNDLLFLPILKLNELLDNTKKSTSGYFAVCVDKDTEDLIFDQGDVQGVLAGANPTDQDSFVKTDQGLDTTEISYTQKLTPDLLETDYRIKLDNRFGSVIDINGNALSISTIDESNIASFDASLSAATAAGQAAIVSLINNTTDSKFMTIGGPRGTTLRFKVRASNQLQFSDALFTKLGGTMSSSTFVGSGSSDLRFIDTIITISGGVTGYQIDVPVRFLKKI